MSAEANSGPFAVGDAFTQSRTFTERDVELFAELTGDRNPIHLDEEFARGTRFGRRIVHGMLTASLIGSVIAGEIPGAIYISQTLFFVAPVYLGDAVTATVSITSYNQERGRMTLETVVRNQDGLEVVRGEAIIRHKP